MFGFDNTLVNSEDLIVELTSQILGIDMSKEFWYTNLHSVTDIETEMQILEDAFHVSYTGIAAKDRGAFHARIIDDCSIQTSL